MKCQENGDIDIKKITNLEEATTLMVC